MKNGELTAAGCRASGSRRMEISLPWILLLAALLGLEIGCSSKDTGITYPPRPEPEPEIWFYSVWGSGPNDVYVAGQPGLILHYDGSSWTVEDSHTQQPLIAVWGASANEVYACGHRGTILRRSGGSWSAMNSGTTQNLYGVGRFQDGAIYVAGGRATVLKLSGNSWIDTPNIVLRYNPSGTAIIDSLDRKEDVTEDSQAMRVVTYYGIAGFDGAILMSNTPDTWRLKLVANEELITAGWSNPDSIEGNFMATEEGRLYQLRLDLGQFSWGELPSPASSTIYSMWSPDRRDFYFVTQEGDVIRQNLITRQPELLYNGPFMLYGIWGSSANDIYAVGIKETILHNDGSGVWSPVVVPLPQAVREQALEMARARQEP
jgi:hypothetical protein